jgi:hypothetical protein
MAGRRWHSPEQIVRKLREADKLLGQGQEMAAVLKHLEIRNRGQTTSGAIRRRA